MPRFYLHKHKYGWRKSSPPQLIIADMNNQIREYLLSDIEYDSDNDLADEEDVRSPRSGMDFDLMSFVKNGDDDDDVNETATAGETLDVSVNEKQIDERPEDASNCKRDIEDTLLTSVHISKFLKRSISYQGNPSPQETTRLRRSQSVSLLPSAASPQAESPNVSPSIHCIQKLLPAAVCPSSLGPTASASIDIVSTRAVIAILWSIDQQDLHVIPLVGCGDNIDTLWCVAKEMQFKIRERLSILHDGSWMGFLKVSEAIASRKDEWILLLEELCPGDSSLSSHQLQHFKPLCERQGLSMGESKDMVDLYRMVNQRTPNKDELPAPQYAQDYNDGNYCLVCLDELQKGSRMKQLIPCGHRLCLECLIAYIKSSAGSGESSLRCAAFQCSSRLDIYDIAHALFDGSISVDGGAVILFKKLIKFEIEKTGMEACQATGKTCFCPSLFCNRLLVSSGDGNENIPGSNTFLCACGMCMCAGICNLASPSHPGVSCKKFQELYKSLESGRLGAELASIEWMLKHSRPCPKCRYPIERDGGCNHVRCCSCQYYFCWQCGGNGNECMAFFCKNQHRYWHQEPEYDQAQYDDLYFRLYRFRSYRNAEKKLTILRKTLASDEKRDTCIRDLTLLDLQLTQVALWIHGFHLIKDNDETNGKSATECPALDRVELMIHVLSLRKVMAKNRLDTLLKGSFSTDEVAAAMGLHATPQPKSKAKRQAKARREATKSTRGQHWNPSCNPSDRLIVDHDLEELCKLPDPQLERKVSEAMRLALAYLLPSEEHTSSKNRRRKKRHIMTSGRLNEKMDRRRDPWRLGMKRQEDTDELNSRWDKGKHVVTCRRQQSLEQTLIS